MSKKAVRQHAHAALLYWHAWYRHFLPNSPCLSLNLLGIAKEHTSVFAYIESVDDPDLCCVTEVCLVPFRSRAGFCCCTEVLAFACCSPFLMVNGEWVSVCV